MGNLHTPDYTSKILKALTIRTIQIPGNEKKKKQKRENTICFLFKLFCQLIDVKKSETKRSSFSCCISKPGNLILN